MSKTLAAVADLRFPSRPPRPKDAPAPRRPREAALLLDPRGLSRECVARWLAARQRWCRVTAIASPEALDAEALGPPDAVALALINAGASDAACPLLPPTVAGLVRRLPGVPVVLLSERADDDPAVGELFLWGVRRGVRGVIPMTLPEVLAIEALRCVRAGGTFVPSGAFPAAAEAVRPPGAWAGPGDGGLADDPLTPRERAVLVRVREGKPNKIIAHELGISLNTVKVYVRTVLAKLGATNRTQAALRPGPAARARGRGKGTASPWN